MGARPPFHRRRRALVLVPLLLALVLGGCSGGFAGPGPTSVGTVGGGDDAAGSGVTLTVSAASDLAVALDELGRLFTEQTGVAVVVNLGSSGQLAQQIERGAPVDVFFSADRQYVDELVEKGIVDLEDTALYGVGRVTLWTGAVSALRVETLSDLTDPAVKRIAIANPDHAPYGRAAREALQSAGLWEDLQPKIVMAENVLQALQFADSGNADVALIARSLSVQGDGRWTLVPAELHQPIEQTLAVISQSPNVEWGRRFAEFVTGPSGRPILDSCGFVLP
ncbi:MAG: molybdate ABC transporter substrate-binding protein [Thermoleophilia bacterium]